MDTDEGQLSLFPKPLVKNKPATLSVQYTVSSLFIASVNIKIFFGPKKSHKRPKNPLF